MLIDDLLFDLLHSRAIPISSGKSSLFMKAILKMQQLDFPSLQHAFANI
jgi:hypothetical protein